MHDGIVRARPCAICYRTVAAARPRHLERGHGRRAAFDGTVAIRVPTFRRRNPALRRGLYAPASSEGGIRMSFIASRLGSGAAALLLAAGLTLSSTSVEAAAPRAAGKTVVRCTTRHHVRHCVRVVVHPTRRTTTKK